MQERKAFWQLRLPGWRGIAASRGAVKAIAWRFWAPVLGGPAIPANHDPMGAA